MKVPPADISFISEQIEDLCSEVLDNWEPASVPGSNTSPPPVIKSALVQLMDVLHKLQNQEKTPGRAASAFEANELQALGNYGLQLLSEMAAWAGRLGLEENSRQLELLCFPFAVWTARLGGEISTLEPVVNALAYLANQLSHPESLTQLYNEVEELVEAVNPGISQDMEQNNPQRPWRILLLNRAIIATRSLRPELMESAFDTIVELLPGDAADFFAQGMEQLDIVGYPPRVKEVMEAYYIRYGSKHILH